SIDLYNPYVAVINNISADHKSLSELRELFQHLSDRTAERVIINDDYDLCRTITHKNRPLTFSLQNPQADFYASQITPIAGGVCYNFCGKDFSLNLIGALMWQMHCRQLQLARFWGWISCVRRKFCRIFTVLNVV
ncbi:MAG: hypothetical protein IKO06_01350, partial [Alphaproteobacteria bacterium]|nr:hypothetical protein [Alphaproteobacteria bacterium]